MKITQARLKELVFYSPIVGVFEWRKSRTRVRRGFLAGAVGGQGYVRIFVDGKSYPAHQLAWLYMTGDFPDGEIDHRDGDRSNNAWGNLRLATREENSRNKGVSVRSKSGIKGVYWVKSTGKWRCSIMVNRVTVFSKVFDTKEEAADAVKAERERLHGNFANHGKHVYELEEDAS